MNILLLGPARPDLSRFLQSHGDTVVAKEKPLSESDPVVQGSDFLISYGYRHLLQPNVLAVFPDRAVNLHISMLPWNRGTDPNLWSFLEDTPKGVTIHHLDAGLDTGDVIAQAPVQMLPGDTLRTSYDRLCRAMEELFRAVWPAIRQGHAARVPQPAGGSSHTRKDRKTVDHLLTQGWDTPVSALIGQVKTAAAGPAAADPGVPHATP